jgi:mRNA interferase RelE/StbE
LTTYEIEYKKSAAKEIAKLDQSVRKRIIEKIERLAKDPFPPKAKWLQNYPSKRRIDLGDYRIIYQVYEDKLVIEIVKVGHRSSVYKEYDRK